MRIANNRWPARRALLLGSAALAVGLSVACLAVARPAGADPLPQPIQQQNALALPPAPVGVSETPRPAVSTPGMVMPAMTPASGTASVNSMPATNIALAGPPSFPGDLNAKGPGMLPDTPQGSKDFSLGTSEIVRNNASVEQKIIDNAKSMVKRLDTATDIMTLQELNNARQTVARLEAMIEVEKKLSELDKAHNDRSGERGAKNSSALASAIPASALAPLPAFAPRAMPAPPHETVRLAALAPNLPVAEKPKPTGMEVTRIYGTDGRYTAMIRLASGETKSLKDGDHVSDHITVHHITPSSVQVDENGGTRTLHVKNVEMVYSAMR